MSSKGRIEAQIIKGIAESLSAVAHHKSFAGIQRQLLLGESVLEDAPMNIAVHSVANLPEHGTGDIWRYTVAHKHDYDEINIIWSDTGKLLYLIELDNVAHEVESPATVVIPAGVMHRAEAISGMGSFFCIRLTQSVGGPK